MKHTQSAGAVVINAHGEIIVVRAGGGAPIGDGGSWSLPKGHVDSGEMLLSAARRELFEEAGITDAKLVRELGTYERYRTSRAGDDDTSERKTITMFLFTSDQKNLQSHDVWNSDVRWVPRDEVAALLTHKKDVEFFLRIAKEL